MKRVGNIFKDIFSFERLMYAAECAAKNKMYQYEVKQFMESDYAYKIDRLSNQIASGEYRIDMSDYTHMERIESGKLRSIYKTKFYPHRIVQWAILNAIRDTLMKTFDFHSYASIPGKGVHQALLGVITGLKTVGTGGYCLKLDVKKFYSNIDKDILMKLVSNKIKCKPTLTLISKIVYSFEEPGLPIGNLLSQYLANLYLTKLDKYCRHVLKIKRYYRYMDDIIVLDCCKARLHYILHQIQSYLSKYLKLELKPNYYIRPISIGVDIAGYISTEHDIFLRTKTFKRLIHKCMSRNKTDSMKSYKGWILCTTNKRLKNYINNYPSG